MAPLAAAGFSLLAGLGGGLARLGLVPEVATTADHHGALMIGGVFGTLVALERAVADGRRLALAIPVLAAAGSGLLIAGRPGTAAVALLLAGLALLGLTAAAAWRLRTLFAVVMTVGATLWPFGTACGSPAAPFPRPPIRGWASWSSPSSPSGSNSRG